nr:hypothetical protein [uncultured Desulfobacter sp.]
MELLIPTSYKEKLPKDISYPVGAELISQHLEGVPQFNELKLSFFFWTGAYHNILNRDIHTFLEVTYSRSENSISNTKKNEVTQWVTPEWRIGVSPVPGKIRKKVREVCIAEGFEIIKDWLLKDRPNNWYYGRKSIKLLYDATGEKLQFKETT